jgi:predicted site-specific integrase-resolvase
MTMTTKDVCKLIGVQYYTLQHFIRTGQIPEPPRNSSRFFDWSEQDVERVKKIVQQKSKKKKRTRVESPTK